jgi:hypothetical protein
MFNNANTTNAQGANLFAPKPAQTNQPATTAPAGNLFNQNQNAQGTQGTQGITNPAQNIFGGNNTASNQANTSNNPGQNNPVGGNPGQGGMFNNPISNPPKDDLESTLFPT